MSRGVFPNGNSSLFKKGCESWNKGKKHSEETKKKISDSKSKGERIVKLSTASWLFKKIKEKQKECENCSNIKDLHIHHLDENRKNNNIKNLVVLCRSCHLLLHSGKIKFKKEEVK